MAIQTIIIDRKRASDDAIGGPRLLPAAISATGQAMFLHFSAIGNALLSMHDIDPSLQGAMKVRLSAFQRMGFPLSERLKSKAKIGIDDALKLVFAFELLEVCMLPNRAIRLTTTDWSTIREAIAKAWLRLDADPKSEPLVLVITPRGLEDFGAKESTLGQPLSETAGLFTLGAGPVRPVRGGRSSVRTDVGAMAVEFVSALHETGFAPLEDINRAMRSFAEGTLSQSASAELSA